MGERVFLRGSFTKAGRCAGNLFNLMVSSSHTVARNVISALKLVTNLIVNGDTLGGDVKKALLKAVRTDTRKPWRRSFRRTLQVRW